MFFEFEAPPLYLYCTDRGKSDEPEKTVHLVEIERAKRPAAEK